MKGNCIPQKNLYFSIFFLLSHMNKQATKKLSGVPVSTPAEPETENPTTTENNKTNLGKRKKYEPLEANSDGLDDLDSVIVIEAKKKIQKVTLSNTIYGESVPTVEKMKCEIKLDPILSFVQTKMACACGYDHTITLSNDGTVYSFGRNFNGELGLGHYNPVSLPTPIPTLPKINQISCGVFFTVCVDYEGFIWSFGSNTFGQLGTGNKTEFNVPQKLEDIPPVLSVSCGNEHTLIITNDSNLWSCGRNLEGQLCHGDTKDRSKPQQTSFSNISKISTGYTHSLFQNNKGEIFACGKNEDGLGQFNYAFAPSLIHNTPPNIVHFVCGGKQNSFLDSEGNVFSVGNNRFGSLGLGHKRNQNELNQIPNIPPIKVISCVGSSCYLIDFEGNLWTFGSNDYGQLGHGDKANKSIPEIINTVKDIQQISYGSCGRHFLAKNSQNQIFATGNNFYGQLGTGDRQSISILQEIDSQYSTIWRNEFYTRAKSARK